MLIRIIKREHQGVDLVGLEHAARAEIDRVLGPDFRFPAPPPPTTEFRVYFYQQDAWWVALPLIGCADTWAVDLVGDVVPDDAEFHGSS